MPATAIATAAVAAAKVAISLAAKRRAAVERGEKEPIITEERVEYAKAKARKLIAKARSEEAKERRQDRRERVRDVFRRRDRDDDELDVKGDRQARRRPPVGDRPLSQGRGSVLWPSPRSSRSPRRPSQGVSMVDPGLDGMIRLELQPVSLREAAEILHALTRINVAQMQAGARPVTEGIASGAISYFRPKAGTVFKTLNDLWDEGGGDCGPLSAAYAAERTLAGHPSVPYLYFARPGVIHAVVRDLATGDLLDPSIAAGMGR